MTPKQVFHFFRLLKHRQRVYTALWSAVDDMVAHAEICEDPDHKPGWESDIRVLGYMQKVFGDSNP